MTALFKLIFRLSIVLAVVRQSSSVPLIRVCNVVPFVAPATTPILDQIVAVNIRASTKGIPTVSKMETEQPRKKYLWDGDNIKSYDINPVLEPYFYSTMNQWRKFEEEQMLKGYMTSEDMRRAG